MILASSVLLGVIDGEFLLGDTLTGALLSVAVLLDAGKAAGKPALSRFLAKRIISGVPQARGFSFIFLSNIDVFMLVVLTGNLFSREELLPKFNPVFRIKLRFTVSMLGS